jgi:hypothetical protein
MLSTISCSPEKNSTIFSTPTLRAIPPTILPNTIPPTTTPVPEILLETIQGSFRNQISYLEENMPRANSEAYVVPTKKEQDAFAELVAMLVIQDLKQAAHLAAQNNYRLQNYEDRGDDNAVSYLLRENKPIKNGWGLYAFRVNSTSNIIIEAPHPRYDRRTPTVAINLYRALDARALLIAGAHRNANSDGAADMAHTTESIFHSIHTALSQELRTATEDVIILQIHGFHTSKHDGYPQAVLGFGKKMEGKEFAIAKKLENVFSKHGITVGLCTGDIWLDLCGTKNAQASVMNGGVFIHIELDEKLRRNDDPFVAALVEAFGNGGSP